MTIVENRFPANPITSLLDEYRSALLTFDSLQEVPEPSWLIRNVLPQDGICVLFGASTAGKTFIALDWAMSVATNTPWLAKHEVTPAKVLYVVCEGIKGMKLRANAWAVAHGTRPYDDQLLFLARSVNLLDEDRLTVLKQLAREQRPKLIVVDTLGRSITGHDENNSTDMGRLIEEIDELRKELEVTVLFVHHPNKSIGGGMRGSGRFTNDVEAVYELTMDDEEDPTSLRTLMCRKQKDGEAFRPIAVYLQRHDQSLVPSAYQYGGF